MKIEHVLIVGGGMAGLHTARLLRERGFGGHVTLLSAEPHAPYDRPPLSKAVLEGKSGTVDELAFPFDFGAADVELRLGERGVAWEPGAVTTSSGAVVSYDALVLATGSEPVRLPFAVESAMTLRTYEDAVRLRDAFAAQGRVLIVGAGWIGAEAATAARAAGCEVTVLEALERPLAGLFPQAVGDAMAAWYAEAGIDLRLSSPLSPTDRLDADTVLVAVGARPDVRWLGDTFTYASDGALLVDEHLATNVPGVYAVGDCASYYSRRYRRHLRVEHWDNALRGPDAVVAGLLGEGQGVHDPVPYFWSEQFGRMVQYAGRHSADDTTVVRGDLSEASWSVCWLDAERRLTAVLAVGKPRDLAQGRKLIAAGTALSAEAAADASRALTAAAA